MTAEKDERPLAPSRRLGIGAAIVLVIVAVAVTVAIGIIRGASTPVEEVRIDAPVTDAATPAVVQVHVSGAVAAPGLYLLSSGARVVDAIASAGGFGESADRDGVNLARPVTDGEQLHVPAVGEVQTDLAPADPPGGGGGGVIDLNTADEGQLDTLPRIGPALAQRIIQWREDNGRFTSVEDLLAVPGIGDKMLESLRDLVRV
ncbi:helix-hairpin-helix domain-containing protein [Microbacterium sp. NPDC057407]|uniref:helix-hairpin-helix domain-containing protein n=1 Tax=Microbacterium sp. NPDC057407 TaxID=3346120 RepID=UPI00366AE6BF